MEKIPETTKPNAKQFLDNLKKVGVTEGEARELLLHKAEREKQERIRSITNGFTKQLSSLNEEQLDDLIKQLSENPEN